MENGIVSEDKNKPVLDEQTLAKLLEAAYVLQEHNREMRALELSMELKRDQVEAEARAATPKIAKPDSEATPPADYTLTLAQIVETQHHIQLRQLSLEDAMTLVAERLIEIGRASGAAVGIVEATNVRYRAVAGQMALPKGATVSLDKSLCIPCVKTGQVFRCEDVNPEFLLDAEACRKRGIASMIAVPVFHGGGVAGGLELYYSRAHAFTDQDVHTCQLMAGLITEALARDEELTWKKSLATERAAMLDALEKLKPNLAALLGQSPAANKTVQDATPAEAQVCRKCGHKIVGEEQFCGQCGSPRSSDYEPPNMQRKLASLWQMQEALKKDTPENAAAEAEHTDSQPHENVNEGISENPLAQSIQTQVPEFFEAPDVAITSAEAPTELLNQQFENEVAGEEKEAEEPAKTREEGLTEELALAKTATPGNWSSAASARAYLEQLTSGKGAPALLRLWNSRRGDIYLAIAVILVFAVIRWGIWSNHSVAATAVPTTSAAQHKSSETDLSLFDRMLIRLGLADLPEAPEDKGNPSVQVWVDTHTGLYYCPGSDLYGKTQQGKFATQREAELDQFQPAYRKTCN